MPDPNLVAAFVVGRVCPSEDDIDDLVKQVERGLLDLEDVIVRSAGRCAAQTPVGTNVITIGIWAIDADAPPDDAWASAAASASEDELLAELTDIGFLPAGRTAGLWVRVGFVQQIAQSAWRLQDKKIGRVTLRDSLEIGMEGDELVSKITGKYELPSFLPDLSFTYTTRDRFSLAAPGSDPPLQATVSSDLDVGASGALALALLAGMLSPILGGIVFFATEPFAESQAPDVQSPGDRLARL
jgi:hypothetical protein